MSSLTDNGIMLHRTAYGPAMRPAAFQANLAAVGMPLGRFEPVSPADLRQDRTVLADPEEMVAGTPGAGNRRSTQRSARAVPGLLQPPSSAPSPPRGDSRRGLRRHREGPARSASATRTSFRDPQHCWRTVRPPVCRALPGQCRPAVGRTHLRQHPPRQPHRHLQRHQAHPRIHRRPHPRVPGRREKHPNLPHTRTQTPILSVSDVPKHKCQRCPETHTAAGTAQAAQTAPRPRPWWPGTSMGRAARSGPRALAERQPPTPR